MEGGGRAEKKVHSILIATALPALVTLLHSAPLNCETLQGCDRKDQHQSIPPLESGKILKYICIYKKGLESKCQFNLRNAKKKIPWSQLDLCLHTVARIPLDTEWFHSTKQVVFNHITMTWSDVWPDLFAPVSMFLRREPRSAMNTNSFMLKITRMFYFVPVQTALSWTQAPSSSVNKSSGFLFRMPEQRQPIRSQWKPTHWVEWNCIRSDSRATTDPYLVESGCVAGMQVRSVCLCV